MARIASTTTYNSANRASTLKALQERQALLQAQAAKIQEPRLIASPWQGAAQLSQTFFNALGQKKAERQEAAGREQLAQAMQAYTASPEGSPEALAAISALDPDLGQRFAVDAMRARREDTQWQREQEAARAALQEGRAWETGQAREERTYAEKQAAAQAAAATTAEAAKDERERLQEIEKEKRAEAAAIAKEKRETEAKAKEGGGFKPEQDLRKEYNASPIVKNLPTIQNAYERIETGADADTPVGDMAVVYGFMKLQDPESAVREGEYATAENARGVSETVRNMYNRVVDGTRLSGEQRQQFIDQAGAQYDNYAGQVAQENQRYTDIAMKWGIDPGRVLVTPKKRGERKPKPGEAAAAEIPGAAPAATAGPPPALTAGLPGVISGGATAAPGGGAAADAGTTIGAMVGRPPGGTAAGMGAPPIAAEPIPAPAGTARSAGGTAPAVNVETMPVEDFDKLTDEQLDAMTPAQLATLKRRWSERKR
jgi:hypothetical protein